MGKHNHIEGLEVNIKGLMTDLRAFAVEDDYVELLRIIHSPGWTTPAELRLVSAIVESTRTQLRQLAALREELIQGSLQIAEQHAHVGAAR